METAYDKWICYGKWKWKQKWKWNKWKCYDKWINGKVERVERFKNDNL